MTDVINFIVNNNLGVVYTDKTFKQLTTLQIGGPIKMYYLPNSYQSFIELYNFVKDQNIPLFVLGSGSNVLANDLEYQGIVVSFKEIDVKYELEKDVACVYAGCNMINFVYQISKKNLGGLEFMCGIPGTLGGVIAMNAGAYGKTISDVVINVVCLDRQGNLITYNKNDLDFGYRSSLVRAKDLIVLSAKIKLKKKSKKLIYQEFEELKKTRNKNQPLDTKNAGCAFKNDINFPTWYLIDEVGMRGKCIGDAQVSDKHTNFLINKNNATASDMFELIKEAKIKVRDKFGINLIYEWVLLNFKDNGD